MNYLESTEQLCLELSAGKVEEKNKPVSISTYSVRIVKESTGKYDVSKKITCPDDAAKIFRVVLEMEYLAEEIFAITTLDTKNKINGIFEVSRGSLNSSIVHPREVFKRALLQNAASILIAHNHPSGDPTPSNEDKKRNCKIKRMWQDF